MNNKPTTRRSFFGGRGHSKTFLATLFGLAAIGATAPAQASHLAPQNQNVKIAQPIGQVSVGKEEYIIPGKPKAYRAPRPQYKNQRQRRKHWASNPHTRKKYGR